MKYPMKAITTILILLSLVAFILPQATAVYPSTFDNKYPTTVWSDMGKTGSISGRVTSGSNDAVNVKGAYVAIINASNESQEYFSTYSDSNGAFLFQNVNATYSSINQTGRDGTAATYLSSTSMYQVYANISYGNGNYSEGYSGAFGIDADSRGVTAISVSILQKPAAITLTANNTQVNADGQSTITLTAHGLDASGGAVADGTSITMVVTDQTNMSEPSSQIVNNWSINNGSIGSAGQQYYIANAGSGSISTSFGWAPVLMGGNYTTVYAYFTADPTVNASIRIYFAPATASWTGYVVDSFGTGYGGIPVTLHVIGNYSNGTFYELYNMTAMTSTYQPFVGLYVFDYIVAQNAVYGYVDSRAQITDNISIFGKSDNYSMNLSATSLGSIVLKVPSPDAIQVTAEKDTILVGGESDQVIAQLYLNGLPYKRANVTVTFSSDNDSVATLPDVKAYATDVNGQARITLTSNYTAGNVDVTGNAAIMYQHNLTDTTAVRVVGWGTVSGIVTDENKVGIPNANVTLWNVRWDQATGAWIKTQLVNISENPQLSNDGRTAAVGMYTFYRVPWDVYELVAEDEGHTWYATFVLGPWPSGVDAYANASYVPASEYGTATHNIVIPDYTDRGFFPPVTSPSAVAPTQTATPTSIPTAKPTPGFGALLALAGLAGVICFIVKTK